MLARAVLPVPVESTLPRGVRGSSAGDAAALGALGGDLDAAFGSSLNATGGGGDLSTIVQKKKSAEDARISAQGKLQPYDDDSD